jgi:hypothetical protein
VEVDATGEEGGDQAIESSRRVSITEREVVGLILVFWRIWFHTIHRCKLVRKGRKRRKSRKADERAKPKKKS